MVAVNTILTPNGRRSDEITRDLFGSNTLFHRDSVEQDGNLDQVIRAAGVTFLRYPGGTVTEEYFDLSNPNSQIGTNIMDVIAGNDNPRTQDIVPLSEFLDYCSAENMSAVVVLPTYQYFDQVSRTIDPAAETEIRKFIRDALTGEYGSANIHAFEIGNEWYQHRFSWNPNEFAAFQEVYASWVADEIGSLPAADRPSVFVQAGQTEAENEILASAFSGQSPEVVDGVITHLYGTNASGDPLGIGGGIGNRLHSISDIWGLSIPEFDLVVTEWNVGENGPNSTIINGIMRTAPLLRIFSEMVEEGVDLATIWTAISPGPAGLNSSYMDGNNLSPTGYLFNLLSSSLIDTQLVGLEGGINLRDPHGNTVGYRYVFEGENHTNILVASGVSNPLDVNMGINQFLDEDSFIYARILSSAPGDVGTDYDSRASLRIDTEIDIDDVGHPNSSLTYQLDPYELIQYHIVSGRGIEISGDEFNYIEDKLNGTQYSDILRGKLGDDAISGFAGSDTLSGGSGNDTIATGFGNDVIFGGTGDDLIEVDGGSNRIFGGLGQDTVDYSYSGLGNLIDLSQHVVLSGARTDKLEGVESLIGTAYGDTVILGDLVLDVDLGAGNDLAQISANLGSEFVWDRDIHLQGGAGVDELSFRALSEGVRVFMSTGVAETSAGQIHFSQFEELVGTNFSDNISTFIFEDGEFGSGRYFAADGDDRIVVSGGDRNLVYGGRGDDFIFLDFAGGSGFGGSGDDFLFGTTVGATLSGGIGHDVIVGGISDDILNGGFGDDTLTGQDGADIFEFIGDFGDDTVTDFEVGIDSLEFVGASPMGYVAHERPGSTLLEFENGASLEFIGLTLPDLMGLLGEL